MTDYITRLATLVDKETKQILEDSLDLIKQIKYMVGIAERGTGKKCPDGERPEAFLLAYVKSLEAALAQQDAQVVSEDEIVAAWKSGMTVQYFVTIGHDDEWTDYTNPTPPDTSGTRLAWRVKPGQRSNTAPTPPAQQDHGELYAQGWINGWQVQSLIDWCNSGCAKRVDIAFAGGSTRQMAYAIEHLVKRASNTETSEGVFVPRELLAKVANALGLPYEAEHTRLRSKLLDILSFAAPAQQDAQEKQS